MMTIKHIEVRKFLIASLIILLQITPGCKQQATPRPPLSANEVKTIAAEFERVSKAHIDAWNKHDYNLIRQLYTDDIKYYETDNWPDFQDISNVSSMAEFVLSGEPNFDSRQVDTFIGREDGFDIDEMWNYNEEFGITKDNPAVAYDWFTLRDGKIAQWWLFWSPDTMEKVWTPGRIYNHKPLQDYASAWSSGDPQSVTNLYDPKVVRQDTLYRENQQGSSAVKELATNFFAWYPGVRMELLQPFDFNSTLVEMTGGVYAIRVSDQAGKSCDVRAVILLESAQDKITKEWIFYNADSLITCGWAQ